MIKYLIFNFLFISSIGSSIAQKQGLELIDSLKNKLNIFERFAQVDQGESGKYGGAGLGLSIVKGLIDLLGGKIYLKSEPHKGSTFYFTIPYKIDVIFD